MLPIRGAVCYHILPYNIWSLNSDLLLGSNSSQCIQSQTLLRAPVMIHDCNSAPFPADIFLFVTAIPQSDSVFRNSTHPATSMSATMDASGFLAANTVRTHKHSTNPRNVLFSYKKTTTKHSNKMSLRRIPIPIFINVSNAAFSMAESGSRAVGICEVSSATGPGDPLSIIASQPASQPVVFVVPLRLTSTNCRLDVAVDGAFVRSFVRP